MLDITEADRKQHQQDKIEMGESLYPVDYLGEEYDQFKLIVGDVDYDYPPSFLDFDIHDQKFRASLQKSENQTTRNLGHCCKYWV